MNTKQLRQKILDLAIRGKLVPQDPNDEPASVLLERIKAEKEKLIKEGKIKRSKKSATTADKPHYPDCNLPSGWVWVKLEDIAIDMADGPFGSNLKSTHYTTDREVRIIQLSNIGEYGWRDDNVRYTTFEHARDIQRSVVDSGDIVIAKMMPAGRAIICPNKDKAYVLSSDAVKLKPSSLLNIYYLLYAINSPLFQNQVNENVQGVTRLRTSIAKLKSYYFPLPPLNEQTRIVDSLIHYLGIIDNIQGSVSNIKGYVVKVKSKILELAISGKLVPQDPADEPAEELLRRINPSAVPADKSHYQHLPQNWCTCKLEDIVDYEQPQRYIVESTDYNDTYKTPVLTAGKSFVIGYTNETAGIFKNLPVIIFDDFTTDSKYVDFHFKVKSSAMKILHVKHGINIKYVYYFMSITRLVGKTHKRYWISEYSKLHIPLPPYNEQCSIVAALENISQKIDDIVEIL